MPHIPSKPDATKFVEYKKHPSPVEMLSEFDKLSEYQVALALESYKGLKIKWHLRLNSLSFKNDVVSLSLFPTETIRVLIMTDVNILDYPELKLLKKGHMLWISGEIDKIFRSAAFVVNLSGCLLEIN